jgi:hypothetical protein
LNPQPQQLNDKKKVAIEVTKAIEALERRQEKT